MGFEGRAIRVLKQNRALKNTAGSRYREGYSQSSSKIDYSNAEKEVKYYPNAKRIRKNAILASIGYIILIIVAVVLLGAFIF